MFHQVSRFQLLVLVCVTLPACTPTGSARPEAPRPSMVDLETRQVINIPGQAGLAGFSSAIKMGKRIYISGQVGMDSTGALVGTSLEEQSAQAFRNLQTVLLAAGATPEDVVHLDIQIVGLKENDPASVRRAGAVFFPEGKAPAGNVIGVQSLPMPGLRIAISAIAETRGLFPDREALRRYQ